MSNPIQNAKNLLKKLQPIKQAIQIAGQNLSNPIKGFFTDIPANLSYLQARASQKFAPKDIIPTAEQMQSQTFLNPNKPELNFSEGLTKSMSAQLNPWPVAQQTPYNQQLEQRKQQILNSGVFRPAMKRYLSTVPIYGDYGAPGGGMADVTPLQTYDNPANYPGASFGRGSWETATGPYQPVIGMGISKNKPIPNDQVFNSVLVHELIHASPRNMRYKDEFINFFNNVKPNTNPMLYKIGLTYLKNGNPPPNSEEFYAIVAQRLGPQVLNIPEIRKFYENLFK